MADQDLDALLDSALEDFQEETQVILPSIIPYASTQNLAHPP